MSTYWLNDQLRSTSDAIVDGGDPILTVEFAGRTERVYSPDSDEYRVTADVIEKAADLGATIIAYSNTWCDATYEAKRYAKERGIEVMPFGSFFAYLKRYGVRFRP